MASRSARAMPGSVAECEASGSPKPPEIELYESYPLTDNDEIVSERITDAFRS